MARSTVAIALLGLLACAAIAKAENAKEVVSAEYVHKGSKHHSEHYPEHKADYYPEHHHEPKLTQCIQPLEPTYLTSSNGCVNNQQCTGNTPSQYCTSGNYGAANGGACTACIKDTFGATVQYAFCDFSAALCIQAKCPKNGRITIRGKAVGKQPTCGVCGAENQLFLFRGTYDAAAKATDAKVLAWDAQSVNTTVDCVSDEVFSLCEKVGIIITDSVSFTFTSTVKAPATCDAGAISLPCPRGGHDY